MSKRKWLLVVLFILLLLGYRRFFYKTWSERAVAKSADYIVAIDIKRITNTVIWNTITTPSLWKKISFSSSGKFDWKDMISIPDYIFIFHTVNQPANAWYTLLTVKDSSDFERGMLHYHFEKRESPGSWKEYSCNESGIELIKFNDKILVGNNSIADKKYIRQVAAELFLKNQFIGRKQLFKNIEASSHLSVQVIKNNLFPEDGIMMANFDKKKIAFEALFTASNTTVFREHDFMYDETALCSTGFTQPQSFSTSILSPGAKEKISKAVNFNIDSLLLNSIQYYQLDLKGISPVVDSAITYIYDDNFNTVQNTVVNNILQPSFSFGVQGNNVDSIYNYWLRNGQLEKTDSGDLFLPVPFVKSYCRRENANRLTISSTGFRNLTGEKSVHCIFFLRVLFTKIPAEILKFLPGIISKCIGNFESMEISIRKKEGKLRLEGRVSKKENDQPIIQW